VVDEAKPQMMRIVYVVDDNEDVRVSLTDLLAAAGYVVHSFAAASDVLAALDSLSPGVFVIDLRLGRDSGLDLIGALADRDCVWPAAIISGHGDIPLAVEAIKVGAFDFLEKPFSGAAIREVIDVGLSLLPKAVEESCQRHTGRQLIATLSPRERQVFEGVVEGLTNKEIATRHGLSPRTVEVHRLNMVNKLGTQNTADLFDLKSAFYDLARKQAAQPLMPNG